MSRGKRAGVGSREKGSESGGGRDEVRPVFGERPDLDFAPSVAAVACRCRRALEK